MVGPTPQNPQNHDGRRLRPGEAGLSRRRSLCGRGREAPVPARKGTTAKHKHK